MRDVPLTKIPAGFFVTYGRAKLAKGARKPRSGSGGGAKPTSEVASQGYDTVKRNRAARG